MKRTRMLVLAGGAAALALAAVAARRSLGASTPGADAAAPSTPIEPPTLGDAAETKETPDVPLARKPEPPAKVATGAKALDPAVLAALCKDTPARDKDGRWTCEVADGCEGFDSTAARVEESYSGAFTAAGREEVVVDLHLECASHAEEWGGWALLRREGGTWTRKPIEAGNRLGRCTPWPGGGKTSLVCENAHTNHGHTYTFLTYVSLSGTGTQSRQVLFQSFDNEGWSDCYTVADDIKWRIEDEALHVDYKKSRAATEPPEGLECETPMPRIDSSEKLVFKRDGESLAVLPELRTLYAELQKDWEL